MIAEGGQVIEMIDLRQAVYYEFVDDITVEIFDQYKWGLKRLGIDFSQELLEMIVYCSFGLESTLLAFCAWTLRKKEKGESFSRELLTNILIDALREGWIPSEFQKDYLKKHGNILTHPRESIWKEAEKILGYELRNQTISDITEEGQLIFRNNLQLTPNDTDKLAILRTYIVRLVND